MCRHLDRKQLYKSITIEWHATHKLLLLLHCHDYSCCCCFCWCRCRVHVSHRHKIIPKRIVSRLCFCVMWFIAALLTRAFRIVAWKYFARTLTLITIQFDWPFSIRSNLIQYDFCSARILSTNLFSFVAWNFVIGIFFCFPFLLT